MIAADEATTQDVAPSGFVWGETFAFDDAGTAASVGKLVKESVGKVVRVKLAENPVASWYDEGVRLSPPVQSWYDDGVRLETPAAAPCAETSESAEAMVGDDAGDDAEEANNEFNVGSRVTIIFPGDPTVWGATVQAVSGGSYSVCYDDGEIEHGLARAFLSEPSAESEAAAAAAAAAAEVAAAAAVVKATAAEVAAKAAAAVNAAAAEVAVKAAATEVAAEAAAIEAAAINAVAPDEAPAAPPAPPQVANIDQLVIKERIGEGTQSEVLLGELPGVAGPLAVKIGLKYGAMAREANVLCSLSGAPGFPNLLHHEPEGERAPGGMLILGILGPSLKELMQRVWQGSGSEQPTTVTPNELSGQTLLGVGRDIVRLLRRLHRAGFVHNDIKPANILLGAEAAFQPTKLTLIDFGSCTRVGQPADGNLIGTALFASVAADDCRPTGPADDIESLVYTLGYLATGGSLPWRGKGDALACSMKRELLTSDDGIAAVTAGIDCATTVAALEALWVEVKRYQGDGEGSASAIVDYEVCLAALGGGSQDEEDEADVLAEFSFMAAFGGRASEEADGLRGVITPTLAEGAAKGAAAAP